MIELDLPYTVFAFVMFALVFPALVSVVARALLGRVKR